MKKKIIMAAFIAVILATIINMVRDAQPVTEAQVPQASITSVEVQAWTSTKDNAVARREALMSQMVRKDCLIKGCVLIVSGHGFDRWTSVRLNGAEGNLAVGGTVKITWLDGGYNAGPAQEFEASLSINPSEGVDKWGDRFLTMVIIDAYGHAMTTVGPAEEVINTLFW